MVIGQIVPTAKKFAGYGGMLSRAVRMSLAARNRTSNGRQTHKID
jgi:hypothetical protein